jgi:hypothetical protein
MRKYTLYIMLTLATAVSAQNVTYNHDDAKQNQFTIAEIGSGTLTPSLYYDLLHSNYAKTAAAKNKLGFRTTAGLGAYMQIDDATDLDSAMIKRAEVEALNVADRQIDLAWQVESDKINNKMSDFKTNIDRIVKFGGTASQQTVWKERYNLLTTAITATKSAYMPNSQRKKQYLAIYADAAKVNELLVKYLVQLSNSKATAKLLNSTYTRENRNAAIAAEAMTRWRDAGWSVTSSKNSGNSGNNGWIIGPIIGPIRPWNPGIITPIDSIKIPINNGTITPIK